MSLVGSLLTALTLLLGAHVAHAQVGCVPNPSLNGPPFDNGRPVPAQGLNMLAPLNGPSFINSLSVIASGTPLSAPVTALNVPTLTGVFPGTSPLAFNTASFGSLLAPDSINAGTAEVDGGFRNYYVGGATLQGPRVMRRDQMFFTAASSASNAAHAYTLGADLLDVKSADLGTGTTLATAKGGFYTYNPYAIAENGATNLLELTTGEANISAHAGSSMAVKYGFSIVPDQLDAVRGSVEDAALGISAIAGGTAFWANGISFSDGNGQFPLTTDSSIIGIRVPNGSTPTIGNFADLRAANINFQVLAWKTGNISGNGAMTLGGNTANTTTGEFAQAKISPSGTAPGAGFAKLEWVAGTNPGTCKLIAYAGTSTTPVPIVDNVGSGC